VEPRVGEGLQPTARFRRDSSFSFSFLCCPRHPLWPQFMLLAHEHRHTRDAPSAPTTVQQLLLQLLCRQNEAVAPQNGNGSTLRRSVTDRLDSLEIHRGFSHSQRRHSPTHRRCCLYRSLAASRDRRRNKVNSTLEWRRPLSPWQWDVHGSVDRCCQCPAHRYRSTVDACCCYRRQP